MSATEETYTAAQQVQSALRARILFVAQRDVSEEGPGTDQPSLAFREGWCRVLLFAVLDYWFARPATQKFRSARDWIFYPDDSPNSFDNVAQFLGQDAGKLRRAIVARRSEFVDDPRRARAVVELVRGQGNGTRIVSIIDSGEEEG